MTNAPGYERARQWLATAGAALERGDLAEVFDAAGRAILAWPDWREPYCLIARACLLAGDAAGAEAYLRLAGEIARPAQPVAEAGLYDAAAWAASIAQWRQTLRQSDVPPLAPSAKNDEVIRLAAGGDVMLGRQMPGRVALRGVRDPLGEIKGRLAGADLAMVNLETCVSATGDFLDKGGRQPYYYHALPEMLAVLAEAGIQCLATANNHAMDYGPAALAQQCAILDACGFVHFGAGRDRIAAALPAYAEVKGRIVAFVGVETETPAMAAADDAYGISHAPLSKLARHLAGAIAVARAHADIVVVSPHWGANWAEAPTAAVRERARLIVELGADAVLGHSAHVLQGAELYAGCPIVYDMGTLLFDRVAQATMKESALFELEFAADGARALTILPLLLASGRARLAAGNDLARIRDKLLLMSRALAPAADIEACADGLRLACAPQRRVRAFAKKRPPHCQAPAQRPTIPEHCRALRSNLVYRATPLLAAWASPRAAHGLEVTGARFASPVRPGRGFVCEVYFRAAAPAAGSRVEARLTGVDAQGATAFVYTHPVAEGIHPPQRWQQDEIVCDRVVVRPGTVLAEGSYRLHWSLVDLERGATTAGEGLFIGELRVSETAPNGVAGVAAPLRLPRAEAAPAVGGWQGRVAAFWADEARPWVAAALAKAGLTIRSPDPVVVRDGPWVLVICVDTERGACYFKALESPNRFEAGLLALLADKWPAAVAQPLAVCAERGWTLTPDGGVSLLKVRDRQARRALFAQMLPRLAQLQIDSCAQVERLLALGVPDRRLERLPAALERLLSGDAGLGEAERSEAQRILPLFRDCCAALAREPLSAGLDHGDLHLDNVRVQEGEPVLFDWDNAAVTHPFCSLLLPYDAENLRESADLAAKASLGEAYLSPWAQRTGRPLPDLVRSLHVALWVAHVVRALMWMDFPRDGQCDPRVAKWIRLWLRIRPLLLEPAVLPTSRPPLLATADNPLLLDKTAIAQVAGGSWHNLPDDSLLTGISFNRKYLAEGSSGNLYFALNADPNDERFDAAGIEGVRKALARGAAAAVVPRSAAGLDDRWPLLRVDHVLTALERLGMHVRDRLFTGQRVLVSGTEGKTGFKNMLRHVLARQISTHAITNSSNLGFSIFASLASIRVHDRIEIVEAAGTHPGRLARRSEYVRPHLFVLTEVGNEHINYHGSQQAVIESKADIVTGLVDGGCGLLNADGENYAAVRQAVLARRRVPLLLFGSTAGCNGRLLERRFERNGWIVSADIEGRTVEYRLPLLGEHVPLASVSVLLAAHHLGADVERAAADLPDYLPYESQGVLRRIAHRGGEVLCYDNATRASVLSFRSALRTAARMTPPAAAGSKAAVIGQMIFLGQEAETWHARLAEWIDEAGFDRLILVGRHAEVTYAHLRHPDIVVRRFPDYDRRHSGRAELDALIAAVDELCAPGDLLFVKGELDELGEHLRAREMVVSSPAKPPASPAPAAPKEDASALAGLRTLDIGDLPRYRAAIDQTRRTVWQHYFPFIYLLGQSRGNRFFVEEDAGSICIYYLREKKDERHLCLFVLPIPMQTAVLERCIERIKTSNRDRRANLFRVDADDVGMFRGRSNTRIVACPEEYLYAPADYLDLSGNKKRNLRRAIQAVERRDDIEVADYRTEDAAECERVLGRWAALQREKYGGVLYGGFTENCLKLYDRFPRSDLFGKVIRIDGEICSFGFAGEMRAGMGNLFITYSDLGIDGLNKFLNYRLLLEMAHLEFANASHAGDTPGLAAAKQALVPALMHRPYQVYAG